MPTILIPVLANVAAAAAYDAARPYLARYVPRARPASLALGGGRSRPPETPRGRTSPIFRRVEAGDRRGR